MEFVFDTHSTLSAQDQIEVQVRMALLFDRLHPGDTLPSVRDVEQRTGINRNIVRQAYLNLKTSKLLILRQGKGVVVESELNYEQRIKVINRCEKLTQETIDRAEKLGLTASSFAQLLYQEARKREQLTTHVIYVDTTRALAAERASAISEYLHMNVEPVIVEDLQVLRTRVDNKPRTILTNHFRIRDVLNIMGKQGIDIVPLSLTFSPETREAFARLAAGTNVLVVHDDRDIQSVTSPLDTYREMLPDPSIRLTLTSWSEIKNPAKLVCSTEYDLIVFSNRLWDTLSETIRQAERVSRLSMAVSIAALESVRMRIGVIL
jgi:GntR family transcriptional regulator